MLPPRKFLVAIACIAATFVCSSLYAGWFGHRGHRSHHQEHGAQCSNCETQSNCPGDTCPYTAAERREDRREARAARVCKWLTSRVFHSAEASSPEQQLVVLSFTDRNTCEHCQELEANLKDSKVQAKLADRSIKQVDCDVADAPAELMEECSIAKLPTSILGSLDDKGNLTIYRQQPGILSPTQLLSFLDTPKGMKPIVPANGG